MRKKFADFKNIRNPVLLKSLQEVKNKRKADVVAKLS
jgi:hypothetical protein